MIPGCTHAIDIELDDHEIDLHEATNVYVTIAQGSNTSQTYTAERVEIGETGYELTVYLTQAESLAFHRGNAEVQVNWLVSDGDTGFYRYATNVISVQWNKQLLRQVLPS